VKDVYRIEIIPLAPEREPRYPLENLAALGVEGVTRVERRDVYFMAGTLSESDVRALAEGLLADPILHRAHWGPVSAAVKTPAGARRVEVGYLPGVTDRAGANLLLRARILGVGGLEAAASAQAFLFYGDLSEEEAHQVARGLLANDIIQYYALGPLVPHVGERPKKPTLRAVPVPIRDLDDDALLAMSRERLLSLDLREMRTIQDYFGQEGREPTDVELESLAQTWSEHCVHKTFKGIIDYTETVGGETRRETIDSLINTYLRAATNAIAAPWVRSAFVDNAGIVAFDDRYEVSFKAETHNHPSALEPFSGANTGVGGVVRDVMGVSARPIANTDALCVGPQDLPLADLPTGVLHPRHILDGAVRGVEDYGNKMGIPTVNGAVCFDPGYTANPLVFCGCLGLAPTGAHPRGARPGDLVVALGGRTGRDGLHGATLSSVELTDESAVSGGAVQIGDPVTEKMMLDAILEARDERLYTAITDCGAGGFSSAVSEMGEKTGVRVDLQDAPLKYEGLQPWEIWLSESQERMVLAVPPENEARLRAICAQYSVEMSVLGTFVGDGRLHLLFGGQVVADMSMQFLHKGLPRREMTATWSAPDLPTRAAAPALEGEALGEILLAILAHPNVRSKEDVVRRFDLDVQSSAVVRPFVGVHEDGPSDAAVIRPPEVEDSWKGLALGCALNPSYGAIDPYAMAICAIDEAVRNVVAVGADPATISILDNFCWGNPLQPDRLGDLVRACKGCYDGALHYGTPFISGKDSLNNEYLDQATGVQTSIPPTLLISALGMVPDVRQAVTADLKRPGNLLYLLGETRRELGGSYYYRQRDLRDRSVPLMAKEGPATARALHAAIGGGLVAACHDLSEGGLAVALAEMAVGGLHGAEVRLGWVAADRNVTPADDWRLFSESNGRYLVEIEPRHAVAFERLLAGLAYARIGHVTTAPTLTVYGGAGRALFCLPIETLREAFSGHVRAGWAAEEGSHV
jgi:phosphoribosylformylglycinamidine synthase II